MSSTFSSACGYGTFTKVFLNYTPATRTLLHLVEPWVVYGRPSVTVIANLINRRGFGHVKGERVPLSDNSVIEEQLGQEHGIICTEDLVYKLDTVGEAFDAAAKFLFPFKLIDSKTEFERKTLKLQRLR
jgi:large subunit ribosomal protein L7e